MGERVESCPRPIEVHAGAPIGAIERFDLGARLVWGDLVTNPGTTPRADRQRGLLLAIIQRTQQSAHANGFDLQSLFIGEVDIE
jgi:hypothetical protein